MDSTKMFPQSSFLRYCEIKFCGFRSRLLAAHILTKSQPARKVSSENISKEDLMTCKDYKYVKTSKLWVDILFKVNLRNTDNTFIVFLITVFSFSIWN